ncbi:SDR family oxidoreductase [Rhodococcus sp. HNM0569]|uniref:SDR family oxidoreductase n=1 Tax=Rhodococcus sp. HNM0569 TaxID=2716340 RepID=UPI00146CCB05|nr:SDR family oxidoreductase [Rhodococcus sp. HNM0569]NLU82590.1 SDR family oxidoreductase [Rhodococcus sp. HNM0569]
MRVFVTGASGAIGSAVVPELVAAGHEVVGLARSDRSAETVVAAGATPLRGDLADSAALRAGAEQADGIIHLAFGNDFTDIQANVDEEAAAVDALAAAVDGSGKAFVFASGTPVTPGRPSTEDDPAQFDGPLAGRARSAQTVLDLAQHGVGSATVRLPRSVHSGDGRYGFASLLVEAAQRSGVSGYVGDGSQRWPAVHRFDAARLFRLVLEGAEPGSVAHAVADEGDSMRSISVVVGERLGLPVEEVPAEDFGFLGTVFAVDQPSSSRQTRQRFGWEPTHPSLLADLATGVIPAPRT